MATNTTEKLKDLERWVELNDRLWAGFGTAHDTQSSPPMERAAIVREMERIEGRLQQDGWQLQPGRGEEGGTAWDLETAVKETIQELKTERQQKQQRSRSMREHEQEDEWER
jgi:hypothetical protein